MSFPFTPNAGGDSTVTIAAISASATSGTLVGQSNSGQESIRVYNSGLVPVFINIGGTATAAASMPIAPGSVELFGLGSGQTTVSAITASGSATLYVTTGRGV
jgi:hypothetical protein